MPSLFTRVYAPSTIGSFPCALTHGHVRQLQAAARGTLVGLTGRTPVLAGANVLCFLDIDSILRRVYGRQKQGIGFGHAKSAATTYGCAATTRCLRRCPPHWPRRSSPPRGRARATPARPGVPPA
jgi:hypothetical protein